MALRRLGNARWLVVLFGLVTFVAFAARRHLGPRGGGPGDGPTLAPAEAAEYVGRRATVCGTVHEASFVPEVEGRPTFLNFGGSHPDQDFTVVIWGRNRGRFRAAPEALYGGARICAAGRIREHRGTPQIEVREPSQIRLDEPT